MGVEYPELGAEDDKVRKCYLFTIHTPIVVKREEIASAMIDVAGGDSKFKFAMVAREPYTKGESKYQYHYHVALYLESAARWLPMKKKLRDKYEWNAHVTDHPSYHTMYNYLIVPTRRKPQWKLDDPNEIYYTDDHPQGAQLISFLEKQRKFGEAILTKRRSSMGDNYGPDGKRLKADKYENDQVADIIIAENLLDWRKFKLHAINRDPTLKKWICDKGMSAERTYDCLRELMLTVELLTGSQVWDKAAESECQCKDLLEKLIDDPDFQLKAGDNPIDRNMTLFRMLTDLSEFHREHNGFDPVKFFKQVRMNMKIGLVRDDQSILLHGASGSCKTTFFLGANNMSGPERTFIPMKSKNTGTFPLAELTVEHLIAFFNEFQSATSPICLEDLLDWMEAGDIKVAKQYNGQKTFKGCPLHFTSQSDITWPKEWAQDLEKKNAWDRRFGYKCGFSCPYPADRRVPTYKVLNKCVSCYARFANSMADKGGDIVLTEKAQARSKILALQHENRHEYKPVDNSTAASSSNGKAEPSKTKPPEEMTTPEYMTYLSQLELGEAEKFVLLQSHIKKNHEDELLAKSGIP